jgi:hypothetical protein
MDGARVTVIVAMADAEFAAYQTERGTVDPVHIVLSGEPTAEDWQIARIESHDGYAIRSLVDLAVSRTMPVARIRETKADARRGRL